MNTLYKRRLWWSMVLAGYTDAAYLTKAIAQLRIINSQVDALGARSRPVRGLAVVGEVT